MANVLNAANDYPLYVKNPQLIKTPTGKSVDDINIENLMAGKISSEDCRISAETLEYQAQIAESVGSWQIAENFRRAAELTRIPDARILEIYNAMRPHRSTEKDLLDIANELETVYNAKINAKLLMETAEVYKGRNMLKSE